MAGQKNFWVEGSAMDDAMCYFFKCFVLTDFFLKKHFERKFIQYLMDSQGLEATIWKFFEEWMLWVVSFLGVDAFLSIWILFALDFYCHRNRKF